MKPDARGHCYNRRVLSSLPKSAQAHLEEILASSIFSPSPKCRDFLRFVVLETLAGRGEFLKERTIAAEVFGKGVNFEPGEDSIVRVRAREVRKRLDEFYAANPDFPVRIELPVGGYIPRIIITEAAPTVLPTAPVAPSPPILKTPVSPLPVPPSAPNMSRADPPPGRWSRRRLLGAGAAVTAVAAAGLYPLKNDLRHSPLDHLWKPVFDTGKPLILSIPILTTETGQITDRVGLGAARAATDVVAFIARQKYPYELRIGEELTYPQMCEQPTLLLSGFVSGWRRRLNKQFRFSLVEQSDQHQAISVCDTSNGHIWGPVVRTNGFFGDEDYGIVTRYFDNSVGQTVLIATGVTTFGTLAAARYLVEESLFSKLLERAPNDWHKKNFQAVIHVTVVGTTIVGPSVVATHFWSE
jgi:hypothetical protein